MRLAVTAGRPADGLYPIEMFGQTVEETRVSEVEVPDKDHCPYGPGTRALPARPGGFR